MSRAVSYLLIIACFELKTRSTNINNHSPSQYLLRNINI